MAALTVDNIGINLDSSQWENEEGVYLGVYTYGMLGISWGIAFLILIKVQQGPFGKETINPRGL